MGSLFLPSLVLITVIMSRPRERFEHMLTGISEKSNLERNGFQKTDIFFYVILA